MANQRETKVITGKVRLSYAHIWAPSAVNDGDEEKYSVSIIISKDDKKTLNLIKQAIENAKENGKAKFGGKIPANLKTPLRDGDLDRPDDENYANSYFLNASSKTAPGIVDLNRRKIEDENEVYSGCYALVSLNIYPFAKSGNKGIAAGLNNIMKVADGESLGGRVSADADFAEVDAAAYADLDDDLL